MGEAQCGGGEHKKYTCGHGRSGGRENTVASQKYTPGSSRARGVTKYIFFFINNRVIGLIVYITLC
jgi:hypothetical protein